ncbi:MAG: response regulator [Chitinophagaceae bacterium]|nr:response regulator [Oligoflexus sp.]
MQDMTTKGRVLIVDDDDDLREAMVMLLGNRYETFEATNGLEALALLEKVEVDVVILDENMPKMGGHECFEMLRKRAFNIPVIFCTGKPAEFTKKRELNLGAFDYISKPLNAEVFLQLVAEGHRAMIRIRQILDRNDKRAS